MKSVPIHTNWGVHHCPDAIIRCIDFRVSAEECVASLNEAIDAGRKVDRFDDITGAGVSLAVLKDEYWPLIKDEVVVSVEKHGVRRFILVDHHDCGAYGGVVRFAGNLAAQREFHLVELRKAKAKLLSFLKEQGTNDAEVLLFYWNERELEPVE